MGSSHRCAGPPHRCRPISWRVSSGEGYGRRRFYNVAEGSLEELQCFFILSQDPGYAETADDLREQSETAARLLNGLICRTERPRARPQHPKSYS